MTALRLLAPDPSQRRWPMTDAELRVFSRGYARYQKWATLAKVQLPPGFWKPLRSIRRVKKSVSAYKAMMECLNAAKAARKIPDDVRIEARLDMEPPMWAVEGAIR